MHLNVDGDPLIYRCGFAAEEHAYDVTVEDAEGAMHQRLFRPQPSPDGRSKGQSAGDQMKAYLAELPVGSTLVSKEKIVTAEPLDHACQILGQTMRKLIEEIREHAKKLGTKEDLDVSVFLSGDNNYRKEVATIKPYKGNRDADTRPVHYAALRQYLVDQWGAILVNDREADDELSIRGWEGLAEVRSGLRKELPIISTIDKDLDQVPGLHYDYVKKVFYEIWEHDAQDAFWRQCLSGDATDNIGGCFRIGNVAAEKAVASYHEAGLDDAGIWKAIVDTYQHSVDVHGDKTGYAALGAEGAALEVARLVRMQQYPDELWVPPGEAEETVSEWRQKRAAVLEVQGAAPVSKKRKGK